MAKGKINPSVSPLPKVTTNVPSVPKISSGAKKPVTTNSLSPLFGQKRQRPVVQSVPTRTPSF